MDTLPSKVSRAPSCIVNDTEQNRHVRCRTCCRPWMWADGFRSATCRSFFHCSLLQLKVCVRARARQGRGGGGERCVLSRDQPARPPCSRSGSLCCGCSASVSRSAPLSSVTDPRRAGSFRVRRETDSRIQPVQLGLPEDRGADAGGGCSLPGRTGPPPRLPERGSGERYPHIPPPSPLCALRQWEPASACCTRD